VIQRLQPAFRSQMENLEIGKLDAFMNAGQEARTCAYSLQGIEARGQRLPQGPYDRHVRAAAEARTYAATPAAVAELVLPCSGDTAQPCCAKINSDDLQVNPACCHNCFSVSFHM
jgi:hypothetical protein